MALYTRVARLNNVTDANDAILDQFTYTLRADGLRESVLEHRLTQATPSGQQPSFSDTTITWDYDEDGRIKSEFRDDGTLTSTPNVPNDSDDYFDTYAYDLNGNRVSKTHVFYDGTASLNLTETTGYGYDSGGDDRLVSESTTNSADPTHRTVTSYEYDDNGSTIDRQVVMQTLDINGAVVSSAVSDHVAYGYDLRHHLVRFDANGDTTYTDGVATGNDSDDTTYGYDPDGNRVIQSDASGTTIEVTDTTNPTGYPQVLEEKDGTTGEINVTYIVGSGVLGQVRKDNSYALEYILSDGHGSTRELLKADGNPLADSTSGLYLHQEYDAFGNFDVAAIPTTRLYVPLGGAWDDSLGMYHFNARDYRATNGEWSSFDPYGGDVNSPASLHKYVFTSADPINGTDPTGMYTLTGLLIGAGIGAMLGGITTVGINYALNRPLTQGLLTGIAVGAIAVPLSMFAPAVGVLLAGAGVVGSIGVATQVWMNPRSTWGQKGVSVALVVASLWATRLSIQNIQANGWYNPGAFSGPKVLNPLTQEQPIAEMLPDLPNGAMVHFTPSEPVGNMARGTYWFRWGDIKNLSLTAVRRLIGPGARGSQPNANTTVVKLVNSANSGQFQPRPDLPPNELNILEYYTRDPIDPDGTAIIQTGNK